jgi:hypothetical protein
MGADTVVDNLEAIAPILQPSTPDSALHRLLASWKASLAEQTGRHGVYLGVALARWQRRHNLHPDLSTLVEVALHEGDGTTLLSMNQARALEPALDALGLEGLLSVTVEFQGSRRGEPPGQPLNLRVGPHLVEIPRDDAARIARFDPAPAILAAGAALVLAPRQSAAGDVPLAWLAPFSAGFALTARWAHQEIELRGDGASWDVVRASLVLGVTTAIVSAATQRKPLLPGGDQNEAFAAAMLPSLYLLRIHRRNLTPRQRILAGSTLLALLGASLALMPRPLSWTRLAVDLSWLGINWVGVAGLGEALDTEAARFGEALSTDDEDRIDEAWARGRAFVFDLVEEAFDDVRRRFPEHEASLPRTTRQLVRRRLTRIEHRLAALRAG